MRPLGIPTVYDRVCQQAVLNRLEGIFEPVFDEANFGYRAGKSAKGALPEDMGRDRGRTRMDRGCRSQRLLWVVNHEKLLTLVNQRVADTRVIGLIAQMLRAGVSVEGKVQTSLQGTPQGGVISPLLSNILLTPFDREMRRRGHQLSRYADDWVVTCRSRQEAEKAMTDARKVLATLGVTLNEQKTRIVHITQGFEF
jgi:RNA-directed DNA polymerase